MSETLLPYTAFALTAALHGALLLGLVWLLERAGLVRAAALREWSWRVALFGGALSACLQLALAARPLAGQWPVGRGEASIEVLSAPAAQRAVRAPAVAAASDAPKKSVAKSSSPVVAATSIATEPAVVVTADASDDASFVVGAWEWTMSHWGALVLAGWLAASLLLLARLVRSLVALRRLHRDAEPVVRGDLAYDLAALSATFDMPAPRLSVSTAISGPLATPGRRILVPDWTLALPADERRAMLAHELWHIRRRDPQWRVAFAVWHALFCAVPFVGLALRRLDAIAELECDAAAARALGDGRPLASCLVRCLEARDPIHYNAFAVAMASPRSPLMQRAERLLEGVPVTSSRVSAAARAFGAAAVTAAAVLLPAFSPTLSHAGERIRVTNADVSSSKTSTQMSLHIEDDDGATRIKLRTPERKLDYKATTKVTFNADETDIAAIDGDGTVSLEEEAGGVTHRVEYANGDNGIARRYWRDGAERPIDADAKQWLSTIIPRMMREAGIDAVARVDRIYKAGGASAVLAEVTQIGSDHARGLYLRTLIGNYKLGTEEVDDTLKLTATIESDYERRNVMSAALAKQKLDKPGLETLLKIAGAIGSDYERAEVLSEAVAQIAPHADLRRAWMKSALAMDSDYERRRALTAMIDVYDGDDLLVEVIGASTALDSDYERREILRTAAAHTRDAERLAVPYAAACKALGSDYEQREALMALVRAGKLERDGTLAVLDAVEEIGSDYERRTIMIALAKTMPRDDAVQARYMAIAQKMSDFEREQVERAAGFTRS
ncbi:M56 family metallopeptidase [Tahibacter soli]|uniref:M56 family metallopeptidase n=1 Tax=Tahibacter soli TaxID=2983605 RepID=A0A9X4BL37_9GAMM|nr:M56 family metallopeptidase [Tahibacter soli]MDC8014922.1 M56 family metallopeptidase [Tahibacter soli]